MNGGLRRTVSALDFNFAFTIVGLALIVYVLGFDFICMVGILTRTESAFEFDFAYVKLDEIKMFIGMKYSPI